MLGTICALILSYGCLCVGGQELLTNPGFENGITGWQHDGFTMETESGEVQEGVVSVKCTDRTQSWQGPGQNVQVTPGGKYSFTSYVKLIDDLQGRDPQNIYIKIRYVWADNGTTEWFQVTAHFYATPADGWIKLAANFKTPDRNYTEAYLYLEGPEPEQDLYFDGVSLQEIREDPSWDAEAEQRIDVLRKSDIHFQFNVGANFEVNELEVQIDHVRHLFGFGSMVNSAHMTDPHYLQYQRVAYYMFNWATNGDYKWRYNRGNRTNPDYSVAVAATDALISHGLKVRGHCMFWAVQGNEPDYVTPLTGAALKDEVDDHLAYMTNITKGKLSHWDVNNELLHGHFFETGTGDPDFTQYMFNEVHKADPVPLLFLNDYDVVSGGAFTTAYLDQIQKFRTANVPVGGIGVQSHLAAFEEPDTTLLKLHLDTLAQADLPIWVTELDVAAPDENSRANWYEKVLRLYFAHPAVEGVIFWGFWDHDMDPMKALVHGYTYALDEAGQRFLYLTKEKWSTHENRSLASGTSFDLRGFQGDYNVTVFYRGKPIQISTFSLGHTSQTVTIDIDGDGQEIQLPVQDDPFAFVNFEHNTTTQNLHTLGTAQSTSQSPQLQCTTRWSGYSSIGDDKYADIPCATDEVMTGCSSHLKNYDYHRDGEQFVISNGVPTCRAIDGYLSTQATQAIARCCSLQGLTCSYKTAGPSGTGLDDLVVVPCAATEYPLGCATWTYNTESDGSLLVNNSCVSENDDTESGVYAYAACCEATPALKCTSVMSNPSGQLQGDVAIVQCPVNDVMTGCNVYSKFGRSAGAYIAEWNGDDHCMAFNGFQKYGDEIGVQAIATCCHL